MTSNPSMRIISLVALIGTACAAMPAFAQTIDKPVATVKLVKQEIYSQRQFRSDIEKVETGTGQKLNADVRKKIIDSQINAMLFRQFCDREKIIVAEAEVSSAIAELKSQLGPGADDAKLDASLRTQGVFSDARVYARQQLLLSRYIQTKKSDEMKAIKAPGSADIMKAYDLVKSSLVRPDTVRLSVIYFDSRGKGDEEKRKGAALMRDIAAQVRNNASKYDEYLLKSIDASSGYKANTSILVEKTPQMLAVYGAAFIDVVFVLKVGEVSALIENEAGYQIARVNEILPQKQLTLSDPLPGQPNATVQDYIAYDLTMRRQNEVLTKIQEELITQLRKEGTVKVFEENIN